MSTNGKSELVARESRIQGLESQGINPYPYEYQRSCTLIDVYIDYNSPKSEGVDADLRLCGRVMEIVEVDGSQLIEVEDQDTSLQLVLGADTVSGERIATFKEMVFLGDWVGFKVDFIFRTADGRLTGRAREWQILATCQETMPQTVNHPNQQRSERHVHLVTNAESRKLFVTRSKILHLMRDHLENQQGFLEVKTPTLQPVSAGDATAAMTTHIGDADTIGALRITSGTYLKRLVIGGFGSVYEISDHFHRGDINRMHYPEMQMMECCTTPADITDMVQLVERLISFIAVEIHGSYKVQWQSLGEPNHQASKTNASLIVNSQNAPLTIDLSPSWERRSAYAMVQEVTGIDFLSLQSLEEAVQAVQAIGLETDDAVPFKQVGDVVIAILEKLVYPNLIQPTFVVDYPAESYPFAKRHRHDLRLVERFELFINGVRLATAHTEQTDPRELEANLLRLTGKQGSDAAVHHIDRDYIRALKYGLPPTGGLTLEIDRLVMLLTNTIDIRDVIYFPIY